MQADLSHFIIEDKQNLGWRFHWLRAEQQEPIDICAQKLNVSVDVIDKIESGQFESSASASETTNGRQIYFSLERAPF